MENKPVTAIIVGAGHRSMVYSKLALTNPELLKIVGVADPDPIRRKKCRELYGFSEDMCLKMQMRWLPRANWQTPSLTALWTRYI